MQSGEYITLSHRWGTDNFKLLERAAYSTFLEGFDIATLTQTFQDAIKVTRRLGARYLWIDSLCIIQNDTDLADWLNEAALMDQVYSHALCNISGTASAGAQQGLLYKRNPDSLSVKELNLCLDPRLSAGDKPPLTAYTCLNSFYWRDSIGNAPLNQRGWVVQERLLAKRVLHFGKEQLFWECRELDACEVYPNGLPSAIQTRPRFKGLNPDKAAERQWRREPYRSDPAIFAYDLWPKVVKAYTHSLLTQPEDKLIAISGIAKRMSTIIHDNYVVGMWRRYLASELLWSVDRCRQVTGEPSQRPRTYRCPTFSWASIDGCIEAAPTAPDKDMLFSIEDISIEYVTEDRAGLVKEGYLLIEGTLRPLKLFQQQLPDGRNWWKMSVQDVEVKSGDSPLWNQHRPVVNLDVDRADVDATNADAPFLCCLPAQKLPEGRRSCRFSCLLLEHVGHGSYQRIGICATYSIEESELILAPNSNTADIPCKSFDADRGKHTFHLV